ncbi:hypothetical protein MIMGU_mgv1a019129mg [Erythranthe guttata]|uniref:Uncharacterized protein n=1 Tax=Erythranthe guttata TaxID=4155 RepID=A0A022PV39_ERYGU|nr:hypothetical protein MIMGU_mgv1a019129mg [Erythranthe guttata]
MVTNQHPPAAAATAASSLVKTAACGNCNVFERMLLFHVLRRGVYLHLCATCVLRLHHQLFCPNCFQVHPSPPPPSPSNDAAFTTCTKCFSSSHTICVPSPRTTPYICRLCTDPNAATFRLKTLKEAGVGETGGDPRRRAVMDADAVKKLFAAAKIATNSMNNAAVAASEDAERKVMEAAMARKGATQALERVAYLEVKEKAAAAKKTKEASSAEVAAAAGGGFRHPAHPQSLMNYFEF